MVADDLAARLRHLHDAAHLMALTSPQTSSFLITQRNNLLQENNLDLRESQRKLVCNTCGTVMIDGWTSEVSMSSEKNTIQRITQAEKMDSVNDQTKTKSMIYGCQWCYRKMKHDISRDSRSSKSEKAIGSMKRSSKLKKR